MVEVIAVCQPLFFLDRGLPFRPENLKVKLMNKEKRRHYAKPVMKSKQHPRKNGKKLLNLNLSSTIDAQVSFDQYMEDKQRIIKAIFPYMEDQQLSKKEWRIQMPTMNVLFLSMYLAIYIKIRNKSMGKDYPSHVLHHIPKIIELEITRWEFGGIPEEYQPHDLSLSLKGIIYPDRKQGTQSMLGGQVDIHLSFIIPPQLRLLPHNVMHSLTEELVKTALTDLTSKARLVEDYDEYKMVKLKNVV